MANNGRVLWRGRRWFPRLVNGPDALFAASGGAGSNSPQNSEGESLLSVRPPGEDELVVCIATERGRLYGVFSTHGEFLAYCRAIAEGDRCFCEIIRGGARQRPHFDIDIARTADSSTELAGPAVTDDFIGALEGVMAELDLPLDLARDVAIGTSHGPTKESYHVVLPRHYHANCAEARAFYERVRARMSPANAAFVDSAVYSTTQQFRLLGSQKRGSGRPKVFARTWHYRGQEIAFCHVVPPVDEQHAAELEFAASLVSYVPEESAHIPIAADLPLGVPAVDIVADSGNIMAVLRGKPEVGEFGLVAIRDNLVQLRRLRPSFCGLCKRHHEHENPYLVLRRCNGLTGVFFHCRRAPRERRDFLGYLERPEPQTTAPPKCSGRKFLARADSPLNQGKWC